jgi:hypothetical protein
MRADMQSARTKIIFVHIPKSGGTTLSSVIGNNYPPEKIYTLAGTRQAMKDFMLIPASVMGNYDCVLGHMGFGFHRFFAEDAKYITILRNPINRLVSLYSYILRTPHHYLFDALTASGMSFDEFIDSRVNHELYNGQARLLASENGLGITFDDKKELDDGDLKRAIARLKQQFALVGTTDRFDTFLLQAQRILGWRDISYQRQNVTGSKINIADIDRRTVETIKRNNEIDFELYHCAADMVSDYPG